MSGEGVSGDGVGVSGNVLNHNHNPTIIIVIIIAKKSATAWRAGSGFWRKFSKVFQIFTEF